MIKLNATNDYLLKAQLAKCIVAHGGVPDLENEATAKEAAALVLLVEEVAADLIPHTRRWELRSKEGDTLATIHADIYEVRNGYLTFVRDRRSVAEYAPGWGSVHALVDEPAYFATADCRRAVAKAFRLGVETAILLPPDTPAISEPPPDLFRTVTGVSSHLGPDPSASQEEEPPRDLKRDLASLLNRACAENGSNTPDFVLAEYLTSCLAAFDAAAKARDQWYGVKLAPGCSGEDLEGPTAG